MANNNWFTTDFNEWLLFTNINEYNIINPRTMNTPQRPRMFDVNSAIYLYENCKFEGLMLGPVALYNKQTVLATSLTVNSLDEFVEFSKNINDVFFLYSVIYFPKLNLYNSDEWIIRYGLLEYIK